MRDLHYTSTKSLDEHVLSYAEIRYGNELGVVICTRCSHGQCVDMTWIENYMGDVQIPTNVEMVT